jgi:hypothetical protein
MVAEKLLGQPFRTGMATKSTRVRYNDFVGFHWTMPFWVHLGWLNPFRDQFELIHGLKAVMNLS